MSNSESTARLARQWAEDSDPAFLNEQTRAAVEHILATTSETMMEDVEREDG